MPIREQIAQIIWDIFPDKMNQEAKVFLDAADEILKLLKPNAPAGRQ